MHACLRLYAHHARHRKLAQEFESPTLPCAFGLCNNWLTDPGKRLGRWKCAFWYLTVGRDLREKKSMYPYKHPVVHLVLKHRSLRYAPQDDHIWRFIQMISDGGRVRVWRKDTPLCLPLSYHSVLQPVSGCDSVYYGLSSQRLSRKGRERPLRQSERRAAVG